MIDVCFSQSGSERLKFAKQEFGLQTDAILHLGGYLEVGDLNENIQIHYAKAEAETLRYYYKELSVEDEQECFKYERKLIRTRYTKFKKHIENGQSVRIWISPCANDYCGLYWLCNEFKDITNKLYVIFLPSHEYSPLNNSYTATLGWLIDFENITIYAQHAKYINKAEKDYFSWLWNGLVKQNSGFRILINDIVVSTDNDFFDSALLKLINATPQSQEIIMGRFLGQFSGCSLSFIASRIERFITDGLVEVIADSVDEDGCYWNRTLAKAKKINPIKII